MSSAPDRYLELAPLAALDALDGEDRAAFQAHLPGCVECREEVAGFERVASRLPLALPPVTPEARVRGRVLAAAPRPAAPPVRTAPVLWGVAAAMVLAAGLLVVRGQRDEARREAAQARAEADAARAEADRLAVERATLSRTVKEERAFRELVGDPRTRLTVLAGLPAAPQARGRVIWNPESREAVLLASGLAAAPPGRRYEVWVIAEAAPAPAGLFQTDERGNAVLRLPRLDVTARARTFAVTLEPESGVPAPTGPMVLAGAVS